jgi:uncharacterized low-complexity protein
MRRILLVSTAAMLMALLTAAIALPAFARQNCTAVDYTPDGQEICASESGGSGGCGGGYECGNGGSGGHFTYDPNASAGELHTTAQGGGDGFPGDPDSSGGSGGRCVSYTTPNTPECVGHPEVRNQQ